MSGHTPGPWRVYRVSQESMRPGQIDISLADIHCKRIDMRSAEALINAAPDLLAALEAMMICFDDGVGQPWNSKELDAARAAIARAKGEQK